MFDYEAVKITAQFAWLSNCEETYAPNLFAINFIYFSFNYKRKIQIGYLELWKY